MGALLGAVLPSLQGVPPDMYAELVRMTWLPSQVLWTTAQAQMYELAQLQAQRALTAAAQTQLDGLRQAYGQTTLRKARTYALLSLRGGAPLLSHV